jgi:hypothetical protein
LKLQLRGSASNIKARLVKFHMRLLGIQEAEKSNDLDLRMIAVRASRYRVFGSAQRIPDAELAVADLRDGAEPADFAERYLVLERHPIAAIALVRKLKG